MGDSATLVCPGQHLMPWNHSTNDTQRIPEVIGQKWVVWVDEFQPKLGFEKINFPANIAFFLVYLCPFSRQNHKHQWKMTHAHTHTHDISHIFLTSLKLPIFAPESCDGDAGEHLLGVLIVAVPSNFPLPQDGSCPHNVHVSYFHMLFNWEKGFSVA